MKSGPHGPRSGILGLTGTPGTGKKSIAMIIAPLMEVPCIGVNDLAASSGSVSKDDGLSVDTVKLKRKIMRSMKGPCVVYGHLLPYVIGRRADVAVVALRCEPSVLKERLLMRGYPEGQVLENVEAELIGLVASEARRHIGPRHVMEFDTTRTTPEEAARALLDTLNDCARRPTMIDWTIRYDSAPKLRSLITAKSGRQS